MAELLYFTPEQVSALFAAAERRGLHDEALIKTVYFLGLRASEAASLRRDDFSAKRETLTVGVLKRSHRAKLPDGTRGPMPPPPRVVCELDPTLVRCLEAHLHEIEKIQTEWLFPPIRDAWRKPTRWDVAWIYQRNARDAGFESHLWKHPHLLRHSRAMHHLAAMTEEARKDNRTLSVGEIMHELQKVLRHASEQTCLRYIHATEESAKYSAAASKSIGRLLDSAKR